MSRVPGMQVTSHGGRWQVACDPQASLTHDGCTAWVGGTFFYDGVWLRGRPAAAAVLQAYRARGGRLADVGAYNGVFSLAVMDADRETVTVGTDRCGSWPVYYRRTAEGWVIGDDPWRVVPSRLTINVPAALDLLFFGFIPGTRTLEASTEECGPHRITQFRLDGSASAHSASYWRLRLATPAWDGREQPWRAACRAMLDEVFGRVQQAIAQREGGRVRLWLSSGLDTRLIAAYLQRMPCAVEAHTFGIGVDEDIRYATALAARCGWPHRIQTIGSDDLLGPQWAVLARRLGLTTQYVTGIGVSLALEQVERDQVAWLSGFAGDLVSGSFLHGPEPAAVPAYLWRLFGRFTNLVRLTPAMRAGVAEAAVQQFAAFAQTVEAADRPTEAIHQWNFDERQRRLILPQFQIPQRPAVLPFADHAFIDFFSRLPRPLLWNQRLYINTLYHDVFQGPQRWLRKLPVVKYHYGVRWHPVVPGAGRWRYLLDDARRSWHYYKQRLGWSRRTVELHQLWRYDRLFRRRVLDRLEESATIRALFDPAALRRLLEHDQDYFLAAGGIWSLLTLAAPVWRTSGGAVAEEEPVDVAAAAAPTG